MEMEKGWQVNGGNGKIQNESYLRTSLTLLAVILFLNECTFDRTFIYKRNYKVGNNERLRTDGFYFSKRKIFGARGEEEFIFPIFFYEDGSVIRMGAVKDTLLLRKWIVENPKGMWGYWGNYQINKDTLSIETISSYGGSLHHERRTRMGLIMPESIYFFQTLDRKGNVMVDTEIVSFMQFNIKPDSTSNWIREKRKYNK